MIEKHTAGRLQITTECNQNCLFCSVPKSPIEELSFNEIEKNVKKLKALGTNDLFITGGEPTIHKDFFRALDLGKKTGFKEITIQSNGINLTKPAFKRIKDYGNVRFDISFHSFEKEIFNKLSNSTHYKLFLSKLKDICDFNIPVFLTIVINKLNYKKLKEHIEFIRKNFPNITHFSLNFIDPVGRAKENKWIVPTLTETQRYIYETINYILDNGLTFRLERVPLCYMSEFEEFSTEARLNVLKEGRLTYFAQKECFDNKLNIEKRSIYHKTEVCSHCFLNSLCPGLNPNYVTVHGSNEIFPVFTQAGIITQKIINSRVNSIPRQYKDGIGLFKVQVDKDLKLFEEAIESKPNKNNIYDTYSYFLMRSIGFRDKPFIYEAWKKFTDKVRNGLESRLLNFYIHFPYCQSSCNYCVYPSTQLQNKQQIKDYLDYLVEETKEFSPLFDGLKFEALSIGGGTPSLMSEIQIKKLLSNVYKYFDFDNNGEKSIEFNPNTTTFEKLKILDEFGFNKISIGIQSLSFKVLKKNNRHYQTIERIRQVISDFKKTDIPYLNVDLLLGLMGDTPEDFLYSFEEVCKMKPLGISVYPIKTNDNYIKSRYGNLKDFLDFYYPLYNTVAKEMPIIAKKQGFSCEENPSIVSYVHPFFFSLKDTKNIKIKYTYSNYKLEPYSNFGLGYYSESCINNMMRYICVDKNNPSTMFLKKFSTNPNDFVYNTNVFAPHYAKVKFIAHSMYEHAGIFRDKYKAMFGTDIICDFPYAINALRYLNVITIGNEEIFFNITDEREIYKYLLFFVGRDFVLQKKATNFQ